MPKPDQADAEERQRAALALDLRTSGMTYAAVAAELGYSDESGPRKAVDRLLTRVEHEGVSELRQLEGQRLDALQRAIWPQACGGDIDSIKAALSIMARRAKLYGLDAPQRVQVGPDAVSDREFAERMVELVSTLRPDTLRDTLLSMPGGIAVLAEQAQTHALADEPLPQAVSPPNEAHSAATDDPWVIDDDWSNIGATPVTAPLPPEPEPEPAPVPQPRHTVPPEVAAMVNLRRRIGPR